jgi:vacuolar protein sorting-associated protein 13A/C
MPFCTAFFLCFLQSGILSAAFCLCCAFLNLSHVIVQLVFTSFSADDEDYEGYEYSLFGQLSEVRIVYLNRFIQEVN